MEWGTHTLSRSYSSSPTEETDESGCDGVGREATQDGEVGERRHS